MYFALPQSSDWGSYAHIQRTKKNPKYSYLKKTNVVVEDQVALTDQSLRFYSRKHYSFSLSLVINFPLFFSHKTRFLSNATVFFHPIHIHPKHRSTENSRTQATRQQHSEDMIYGTGRFCLDTPVDRSSSTVVATFHGRAGEIIYVRIWSSLVRHFIHILSSSGIWIEFKMDRAVLINRYKRVASWA